MPETATKSWLPPELMRKILTFEERTSRCVVKNPQDPSIIASTIIDGENEGSVVTFQSGGTRQALLEGFTIRHGKGTMQYWPSAVLTYGGGIYIKDSSPNITFNVIRENSATDRGGVSISPEYLCPESCTTPLNATGPKIRAVVSTLMVIALQQFSRTSSRTTGPQSSITLIPFPLMAVVVEFALVPQLKSGISPTLTGLDRTALLEGPVLGVHGPIRTIPFLEIPTGEDRQVMVAMCSFCLPLEERLCTISFPLSETLRYPFMPFIGRFPATLMTHLFGSFPTCPNMIFRPTKYTGMTN
ncbi:MAG: hypothetical protein ABDK94_03535 [Atribacterota bacterium]